MHHMMSDYVQAMLAGIELHEARAESAHDTLARSVSDQAQHTARDRMCATFGGVALGAGIAFIWFVTGK